MRVTERLIHRGVVDDIHRHMASMARLQKQISSGRRLSGISEEPIDAARSIRLRATDAGLKQFQKSAQEGTAWMNATLSGLTRVREVMQDARLNALQGGTDTTPAEGRLAMAEDTTRLLEALREVGNSRWEGQYLFGGQSTTSPAFADNGQYQGDDGRVWRDIAPGETIPVNLTGSEVFKTGTDLFAALETLRTALLNNDPAAVRAALPALEAGTNQVLRFEASLGAETERAEMTQSRLAEMASTVTKRISENDDTDMAQAAIDLANADRQYQASLAASARLFSVSLLDFLR